MKMAVVSPESVPMHQKWVIVPCILEAFLDYQTEHLSTGFMGLPRGQLNALEKSSEFFRGTCALKSK